VIVERIQKRCAQQMRLPIVCAGRMAFAVTKVLDRRPRMRIAFYSDALSEPDGRLRAFADDVRYAGGDREDMHRRPIACRSPTFIALEDGRDTFDQALGARARGTEPLYRVHEYRVPTAGDDGTIRRALLNRPRRGGSGRARRRRFNPEITGTGSLLAAYVRNIKHGGTHGLGAA
jgi:hypothetical protein